MKPVRSDAIAARALAQIGTAFRLRGRTPGVALDCVGLAAHAIGVTDISKKYSLKGTVLSEILSYMDDMGLQPLCDSAAILDGDIAVAACSARQFHLMVRADYGWVHSHAGLRKVVHTPGESPWPVVAMRRFIGD